MDSRIRSERQDEYIDGEKLDRVRRVALLLLLLLLLFLFSSSLGGGRCSCFHFKMRPRISVGSLVGPLVGT